MTGGGGVRIRPGSDERVEALVAAAERRVYLAQLITCLAVIPLFMRFATALTAASMGDREVRDALFAHPLNFAVIVAFGMLFVLAWWLLGRRHRAGAALAVALFGYILISSARAPTLSYYGIALALAGLLLVARAWPAMQSASPPAP